MSDILIISDDVVGKKMAGPGIRAWELSHCLGKHFKVKLAIPDYSPDIDQTEFWQQAPFEVTPYSLKEPGALENLGVAAKIILTQGFTLTKFPRLKSLSAFLIIDMYVPFVLENLFIHKWKIPNLNDREFVHLNDLRVFNEQILYADHFLCANERQQDLFVGSLMSLNRINPQALDQTPDLEEIISTVPFGINPEQKEPRNRNVLKNAHPQIHADDILLIWGGVITNWFDPLTLIKAMDVAVKKNPKIKLFFLSTKHPNPLLPEFDMAKEAVELSDSLGLTDRFVFFNPDWVDYDERGAYFSEADIGVSTHTLHIETRYSFRTRILDYFKYDLPIVCTQGDHFAEIVAQEELGITVPSEEPEVLSQAILQLAEDTQLRQQIAQRIQQLKPQYQWDRVAEPLIRYCRKALTGQLKKHAPSSQELSDIVARKKDSLAHRTGKKYFWKVFQNLPLRISARLKRLFKI